MPTVDELRNRLIGKLKDLFQLNQPDLDFGFYRIMHAKSEQVTRFLENNLPNIIKAALGDTDEVRRQELFDTWNHERQVAMSYGVADPDASPKVKEARARYDAASDTQSLERQIYDHLYRFFERYYEDGDFVSRRYFVRESATRAAPYAVPYSGEEVKLVWANMDQYYIKTAEYFTNFTVDLSKANFAEKAGGGATQQDLFATGEAVLRADAEPLRVHFGIVEASEGEHGNVKASDATKRFFQVHHTDPIGFDAHGELVCRFTYRSDPEKSGQDATWREKRNAEAVQGILGALRLLADGDARAKAYLAALEHPAPTDKDPKRPLLARYINQYTARNSMDYFIHKDLGGFLRRELDFYIKNEVMRLDDIEHADAPRAEQYLVQIRVLRAIAGKLIAFLSQLEEFQKKLWLKKKFVVETNYCITLDRILAIENETERQWLLEQIAANDAQREEWVKLYSIEEIQESTIDSGYTIPLTCSFLVANWNLVVDTVWFPPPFLDRLQAAIEELDPSLNGELIHSDNLQAIRLLKTKYYRAINAVYIDPPYNTGPSEIVYKNGYKDSSWLCMMHERMAESLAVLGPDSPVAIAIDDYAMVRLSELCDELFTNFERDMVIVNHHPQGSGGKNISRTHEYMLFIVPGSQDLLRGREKSGETELRSFMLSGPGENKSRSGRPNSFYALLFDKVNGKVVGIEPPPRQQMYPLGETDEGYTRIYPVGPTGREQVWCRSYESALSALDRGEISISDSGSVKLVVNTTGKRSLLFSNWVDSKYNAGPHGTRLIADILGSNETFSYPKSIHLVRDAIDSMTWQREDSVVLDYFAGSGTTAHAIIRLNQEDDGNRKYVLIEMGDYFDVALKTRVMKTMYSDTWRNGKPKDRENGVSHAFKYLRLESYEDCLNNLEFDTDAERQAVLDANPDLAEEHLLHYMLDVETAGSASLLNIDGFADPTAYRLKVKVPGTDTYAWRPVDLIETFNYLLGLRVQHIAAPQTFAAEFLRPGDPDLPADQHTRLHVAPGSFRPDPTGPWWLRTVEGWLPQDPEQPQAAQNDPSRRRRILIVWRKLTGDLEQDNLVLDEWFRKHHINPRDREYDTIYVNGSNNLPNLRGPADTWKVRLIEEDFLRLMWDTEGA